MSVFDEVKDYFTNGESYNKNDAINDMTVEALRDMHKKYRNSNAMIFPDEVDVRWGDDDLGSLETLAKIMYDEALKQFLNVLESFEK